MSPTERRAWDDLGLQDTRRGLYFELHLVQGVSAFVQDAKELSADALGKERF